MYRRREHFGFLYAVLQRLRVSLCLLQDTLHHRVSHDFLQNPSASCPL